MSLSSTSTLIEVRAAYDDNADYDDGAGDIAKARLFKQAVRILIRRTPAESRSGADAVRDDTARMKEELDEVKRWLTANDPAHAGTRAAGSVRHASFREFRT